MMSRIALFSLAVVSPLASADTHAQPSQAVSDSSGPTIIAVDPRVELLQAVQYLAGTSEDDVWDEKYAEDTEEFFGAFREHAAVELCRELPRTWTTGARCQLALSLSGLPELVADGIRPGWDDLGLNLQSAAGGPDGLASFVRALRAFAVDTDFVSFFRDHSEFYRSLVVAARRDIGKADYLSPLEEYYGVDHGEFAIVLTPLGVGLGQFSCWPGVGRAEGGMDFFLVRAAGAGVSDLYPSFAKEGWTHEFAWHEMGHWIVNPLGDKFGERITRLQGLYYPIAHQLAVAGQAYGPWGSIDEHVLRAVGVRLTVLANGEEAGERQLSKEVGRGFFYIRPLCMALARYERHRDRYPTMESFYPEIMAVLQETLGELRHQRTWATLGVPLDLWPGRYRIYVARADGSAPRPLTDGMADERWPAWSPDGTRIAFSSARDGGLDIYAIEPDGLNLVRVADTGRDDIGPSWAPDGTRLVFASQSSPGGISEIYAVTTDGSAPARVSPEASSCGHPAWAPQADLIAFASSPILDPGTGRRGHSHVWVQNADGSAPHQVTDTAGGFPAWAPDGLRIAFAAKRDAGYGISVVGVDGANETQLANGSTRDLHPAYMADGQRISFWSDHDDGPGNFVVRQDGGRPRRLKGLGARQAVARGRLAWSPDGLSVAFTARELDLGIPFEHLPGGHRIGVGDSRGLGSRVISRRLEAPAFLRWSPAGERLALQVGYEGSRSLVTMAADGTQVTRLTAQGADEGAPAWSPDGTQIAYEAVTGYQSDVWVMSADGRERTNVTQGQAWSGAPSWSPDGTRLAIQVYVYKDEAWVVAIVGVDGANMTMLTTSGANSTQPAWSPDGEWIAFISDRDGNDEIYVMETDGSGETRVSHNPSIDGDPAWSPDGNTLIYTSSRAGWYGVHTFDMETRSSDRLTPAHRDCGRPAWSPDGRRLAFVAVRR